MSMRNLNESRNKQVRCDDCKSPPCSCPRCGTCKTCRDPECTTRQCAKSKVAIPYQHRPTTCAEKKTWTCASCRQPAKENSTVEGVLCVKCESFLAKVDMSLSQKQNLCSRGRSYLCANCQTQGYDVRNINKYSCSVCQRKGGIKLFPRRHISDAASRQATLRCKMCASNIS